MYQPPLPSEPEGPPPLPPDDEAPPLPPPEPAAGYQQHASAWHAQQQQQQQQASWNPAVQYHGHYQANGQAQAHHAWQQQPPQQHPGYAAPAQQHWQPSAPQQPGQPSAGSFAQQYAQAHYQQQLQQQQQQQQQQYAAYHQAYAAYAGRPAAAAAGYQPPGGVPGYQLASNGLYHAHSAAAAYQAAPSAAAPGYGAAPPQQPQPNYQPAQPSYQPAQPAQPAYGQPAQQAYSQAAQPAFGQAAQPAQQPYSQPGQPAQPAYMQPGQPAYAHAAYSQPAQPAPYSQPGQPAAAAAPAPWTSPAQQPAVAGQQPWAQPAAPPLPAAAAAAAPPTPAPPNEVTAEELFMKPGRDKRPRKVAVLLRGLPGSGKSFIARKLRELEVEHGAEPPRIHAIDDYFVTEVEKEVEETEAGKKPRKKTVLVTEYLYEAELEAAYQASILKAFAKTCEEGRFPFVVLDAPNVTVDDFRPFFLAGQRAGYEVYVLKPLEMDPEVCFRRNCHGRERAAIQQLAERWEPTPRLFPQLLVDGLFDLPKPPPEEEEAASPEADTQDGAAAAAAAPGPPEGEDGPKLRIKSRWAALEDEAPQEATPAPRKKRRKWDADGAERTPAVAAPHATEPRAGARPAAASVLRKPGSAPPGKSVRWADEAPAAEGFTMGGPAAQQLEQVHWVEGLGPGKQEDDSSQQLTFQEQARAERKTEGRSFRDILFGGRPHA